MLIRQAAVGAQRELSMNSRSSGVGILGVIVIDLVALFLVGIIRF